MEEGFFDPDASFIGDQDFLALIARMEINDSIELPTAASNNNERLVVKVINAKAIGTKLLEEKRRNVILTRRDLTNDKILLKTRNQYYFFISRPAKLIIRTTKNPAKIEQKGMQVVERYLDPLHGTFFKVTHTSLTLSHYSFLFYDENAIEGIDGPLKTIEVIMIQPAEKKNNNNNNEPNNNKNNNIIDNNNDTNATKTNEKSESGRQRKRRRTLIEEEPIDDEQYPDPASARHPPIVINNNNLIYDPYYSDYNQVADPMDYVTTLQQLNLGDPQPLQPPVALSDNNYDDVYDQLQAQQHNEDNNALHWVEEEPPELIKIPRISAFPPKKGVVINQTHFLREVHQRLHDKHVLVIHGMSGVGKSTLASQYGYVERPEESQYQYAVWIDCKNEKTMMSSFTRSAKFLNINMQDGDEEVQTVLETLKSDHCLVVYDNCNEGMVEQMFESFFPSDPDPCHVIITTQLPQSKWHIELMDVDHMTLVNYPDADILQYILGVLKIQDPTQETMNAAMVIMKECNRLTLLMSLIPQYIRMDDLFLPDFVTKYRKQLATLAPLNVKQEDIPLKMIIDSLNVKCKMFLRLLSFMNSLANTHFFTDSAFFVDQQSDTKFSELKQGVAKLKNLSLIEFFDDGKAVKIGHEWIENYLTRSTSNEDIQLMFEHWDLLFGGLVHMERAKCEISDVFEVMLNYVIKLDNEDLQLKYLNTATDCLVNWTTLRTPRVYVSITKTWPKLPLPLFVINGAAHGNEHSFNYAIEGFLAKQIEDNLHMIIASYFYATKLSEKGHFSESMVHLDRCQRYMLNHLSKSHAFCQRVYREYAIALYHKGQYELAEQVLTLHHELRMSDDTKIYLGLVKFQLGYVHEAWTVLREDIFDNIEDRRRYSFPYSQQHGLATLLQCELLAGTPFPSILYQTDTQYEYPMVLQLAQAFYHRFRNGFQSWQIEVNQQAVTFGRCSNEPEQQLVAVSCQGRMLILYRMQRLDHWCVIYTHDFIWPQNIIIP